MFPLVLENWCYQASTAQTGLVLPDGCQDLICRQFADGRTVCFISTLDSRAYPVSSQPGECFCGYRLHPAVHFQQDNILSAINTQSIDNNEIHLTILDEFTYWDAQRAEILLALCHCARLVDACTHLGVTERTLQRAVRNKTGQTAGFWRGLARARRAAALLATKMALVEIATQAGYADQAHMNREFRRWFQVTPAQFRQSTSLISLIASPAWPLNLSLKI